MSKDNSFRGTKVYVGIDVHLKTWRIAPFTEQTALKKFTVSPPSVESLVKTLEDRYPGATFSMCYEAGYSGFWIQRELTQRGYATIVVNAADIPTSDKDHRRKTDSRDASKIARELRSSNLVPIYIPSQEAEKDRSVVRYRHQLVKDERRVKQRIKMYLHNQGFELGSTLKWSKKGLIELEELAKSVGDRYLSLSIKQLRSLLQRKEEVTTTIKHMSHSEAYEKLSCLLQSIPGISTLGSMILITEIVDMARFSNLDHLCSYIGLVPDTSSSGERERSRGITSRSNRRLRTFLIECSWIALRQDPALSKAYSTYTSRMIGNKAIIKIARKLLSRIRHVWLKREAYEFNVY